MDHSQYICPKCGTNQYEKGEIRAPAVGSVKSLMSKINTLQPLPAVSVNIPKSIKPIAAHSGTFLIF